MEKLAKNIPLLSGILIFVGFLHYSFYYSFFGIDISGYLTTGELLLSFLRLTIPILIIAAVLSLHLIGALISIVTKKQSDSISDYSGNAVNIFFLKELKLFISSIKSKDFKKFGTYLAVLLDLVVLIMSLFCALLFIGYFVFIIYQIGTEKVIYINSKTSIVYGIIWFFTLYSTLEILEKQYGNHLHKFILAFSLIGLFLSNIYNKQKAINTLNGKPENEMVLYTKTDTIRTDSNLVFIGKTDKYIFLRNISEKENDIYSLNDISKFTIKKVK